MKRTVAVVLLVMLLGAGAALAARGDPQKKINPADQARAKAMSLRKSDFTPPIKVEPPTAENGDDFYCKPLDESDLTQTGLVEGPDFTQETELSYRSASSYAQVYATVAQANTSWQRGTGPAGTKCFADGIRQAVKEEGGTLTSFKKMPFPAVAPRTVAYRAVFSVVGVKVTLDLVALQRGRAQVPLYFTAGPGAAYPKAEEVRLAKLTAARMATAMRGA